MRADPEKSGAYKRVERITLCTLYSILNEVYIPKDRRILLNPPREKRGSKPSKSFHKSIVKTGRTLQT